MKLIKLSQGYFTRVDNIDYDMLMNYNWFIKHRTHGLKYAFDNKGVLMHRLILGLTNPKILTDHKDGDGLNNQRSNLRPCTPSQNNKNKRSDYNSTSKYLGVSLMTRYSDNWKPKWKAQIQFNGKVKSLGYYINEEDAARAYNEAAIIHHGEFARLNKIKELS